MRMLRTENTILSEGTIETRQTGVGGDAKIVFAILSGMVTDAVEYSIREPGTNAWEANRKRSFEITVPTRFDNTIRWRDFGKGLSHHFMMTRYAKIGDSTKDGSDDDVGGWGFGSKSPLAYLMHQEGAGAFNVISRHQGMRRAYVIGINATGKIQIACLAEEPMDDTDRGTGLEVSFPVQERDIDRFVSYVDRIYWGFSPAPVVYPVDPKRPEIGRGRIISNGSNWALYASKTTPWSGPHIRVGCVLYPVRLELLDGLTGFLTMSDNLLIDAPIGSVDVSTSREQLSYTDRTKDALSKLFVDYETGLVANIQTEADAATSYFDACAIARQGCDVLGWERAKGLFRRISWRGIPCQEDLLRDTSSGAAIRAQRIGGKFGYVERFKAEMITPSTLAGCRVAVEHSPYRSIERLEHAGLVRTGPVLWVRCGKAFLPQLYSMFGLTPADVTILDDIKLPKRVIDPADANKPKTKIRIRKQRTWDGNDHTGAVDMLAGGLYINQDASRHRHSYKYIYLDGDEYNSAYKSIRFDRFGTDFMQKFAALGLLTDEDRERPILIRKQDEVLEGDWIPLGDFLKARIEETFDATQVTPRFSWNRNSFNDELYKLALGFNKTNFPPVVVDLCDRVSLLVTSITGVKQSDTFNQHDLMLDFLKLFVPDVVVPQTADPSTAINAEWSTYAKLHPVLAYAVSEMSCRGNWDRTIDDYKIEASTHQQTLVDDYFALAAAAGR